MKNLFEHIEQVKGKPHHIRKRIAFAAATGGTALVAFVWLASSLGTGAFAITGSSFADSTGQSSTVTTDSGNEDRGLAGAAAAIPSANAPAHIEIIDAASSTRPTNQVEQTTLPF